MKKFLINGLNFNKKPKNKMDKYYEWKYLRHDPFNFAPRLIKAEETRYKPIFPPNISIPWKIYKQYPNKDTVYELDAEQRSLPWKLGRLGRITSSIGAECMGLSSYNTDLTTTALTLAGYIEKTFTEEQKKFMEDGVKNEPLAKIHCEMYHKCNIKEVGLLVPSWKPYIGDSPDGEVTKVVDGETIRMSAEFKCPVRMYRSLEERLQVIEEGADIKANDFTHIKPEHYIQCQFHMYCMNTKYCIYHVCNFNDNPSFFSQIIPFDENFWFWCLKRIDIFYKYYLLPVCRNTDFPLLP